MRTSATRHCRRRNGQLACSARGFTLLEILVVLTIAAVLTGVVVLGFNNAGEAQRLQGEAERLMLRMQLARQRAVQRNQELGFRKTIEGYEFSERIRETGEWLPLAQRPFRPLTLAEGDELSVQVEGQDDENRQAANAVSLAGPGLELDDDGAGDGRRQQEALPDLVFFRSGEVTPFTVTLASEDRGLSWIVSCDGLGRVIMGRDEGL